MTGNKGNMGECSGELVLFKENSSVDACHCAIDPRDRLFVCKLDRNDLEDRHLRLLEEVKCLKKLTNCQEDKIKRLATKLMRSGANSRYCIAAVDVSDESDRIRTLEAENTKLQAKVCLLRSQMSNTKVFTRSPSQGRKNLNGSSSGPINCRSDSSRFKVQSSCNNLSSHDHDVQNYLCKIKELEAEREDMRCHISELESELASYSSTNNREKVAENVEYIRVWRQMKRHQEEAQRYKELLEQACSDHKKACELYEAEKKQNGELEETLSQMKKSQNDLRDRVEEVTDLKSENSILQEHHSKLLEISSKFSKVEQENAELKRKLAEKLSDQQNFKDALSKEKANTLALQAANDQLLTKINDLQKNIDVMSIELMAKTPSITPSRSMTTTDSVSRKKKSKKTSSSVESEEKSSKGSLKECKKCCDEETKSKSVQTDKGVQTNVKSSNNITQTEKLLEIAMTNKKTQDEMYEKNKGKVQLAQNGNSLSRADMLKLLEQVQISTPLESQNASRIMQIESSAVGANLPRSNLETLLFGDTSF